MGAVAPEWECLDPVNPIMRRSVLPALIAPALLAAAPSGTQTPPPAPTPLLPPSFNAATPEAPPAPPEHVAPALSDAQQDQLRAMLAEAEANGLPARPAPPEGDQAALVQAAMDYAQALHAGRLAPSDYLHDWGLRPPPFDPWPAFNDAVKQDALPAWIASLPPPYTGYDTLRKGLANYRAIDAKGGWPIIPDGVEIGVGTSDKRVAVLRTRLAVEDDSVATTGPAHYDTAMVEAVRRAQRRYGLKPTGTLNKETLDALNVTAHDRVRQIRANMERWRWLPATLPTHRIQVNIAAAVLTVFEADTPVTSMRAVTGRPGDETPMLMSQVHSVVFNPPWNVPSSIATKELWPKEHAHPGYLRSHGFRVISTPDGGKRLQQRAGNQSALGRMKFDFDNPYGVYLHDTPTQKTFGGYSRMVSHGCVRLARPLDLAKLVLKDDPTWTPEAIDAALAKGDTVRAPLAEKVAVYLLYWTAFGSADGMMSFRGDPYGWDGELASRIEAAGNRANQTVANR